MFYNREKVEQRPLIYKILIQHLNKNILNYPTMQECGLYYFGAEINTFMVWNRINFG